MRYDVAIAGGGFAGLSAAWQCAEKGIKTVVIERSKEIGYPIKTSGGTFVKTMEKINAPKDLYNVIHRVVFQGPNKAIEFESKNDIFCIIDVRGTLQHLAKKALENGADILINRHAKEPILEQGCVSGVLLDQGTEIRSKLTIDATGTCRALSSHLNVYKEYELIGDGLEFLLYNKDIDKDTAYIYVGSKYAPKGYGWIFPLDDGYARVGVGVVRHPKQRIDLKTIMSKFLANVGLKPYKVLEKHMGHVPIAKPSKDVAYNGFLVIGDASCQLNMATGEGIRYVIDSGFIAAGVAKKALEKEDFSKKFLNNGFNKNWPYHRSIQITYLINKRIVGFTDEKWDKAIEKLEKFSIDDLEKFFLGEFSKLDLVKLGLKLGSSILKKIVKL